MKYEVLVKLLVNDTEFTAVSYDTVVADKLVEAFDYAKNLRIDINTHNKRKNDLLVVVEHLEGDMWVRDYEFDSKCFE